MTGASHSPAFTRGLPQTRMAVTYARGRHAGQRRADGAPFIQHPLEVAALLHETGAPDHVVAAGVLHDVVEKAGVSVLELEDRFGTQIAQLVIAVSDDDRISGYGRRKAALRRQVAAAGDEALTVFAADKLSKLRDLRREIGLDGDPAPQPVRELRTRRLKHYQRSLALLEERLPESSLVRELRAELGAFLTERAVPAAPGV